MQVDPSETSLSGDEDAVLEPQAELKDWIRKTADGHLFGLSGKRICIAISMRTLWSFPSPNILSVSLSSPAMMPEPVHSFQGQKFHKLRRACLHRGVLFKDPLFPATAQSLFYKREPPPGLTWKRPKVRWKRLDGVETNRRRVHIRLSVIIEALSITGEQRWVRLRLYLCSESSNRV